LQILIFHLFHPFLSVSRYEFLEMLARIKVSKIAAFRDIRQPCKNKDLEGMYMLLAVQMVSLYYIYRLDSQSLPSTIQSAQ
jgi:hypothetical protein